MPEAVEYVSFTIIVIDTLLVYKNKYYLQVYFENYDNWKQGNGRLSFSEKFGIHSMQGWTANTRHRVTRKRNTKTLKHPGNLFRKNLQLVGVCWF